MKIITTQTRRHDGYTETVRTQPDDAPVRHYEQAFSLPDAAGKVFRRGTISRDKNTITYVTYNADGVERAWDNPGCPDGYAWDASKSGGYCLVVKRDGRRPGSGLL